MRILVLISGNGTNLQRLIDNVHADETVRGEIVGVISNNNDAYGLTRAKNSGIQTDVVADTFVVREITHQKSRDKYDQELMQVMDFYSADLIVLAGWMRILGSTLVHKYAGRIINLHPALPNSFVGAHCIRDAWEEYQKGNITETGVMTHWVSDELDRGDCIQSIRVPIHGCDTFDGLKERMSVYEKDLLESTVKQLVELEYTRDAVKNTNRLSERFPLLHKGKVRDIYDMGNDLLAISHSDRLSSFDRHICNVLGKGHVLTESSAFWFDKIKRELDIDHHLVYTKDNVMVVKKCRVLPIEVVIRGYITGSTQTSLWTHYKNGTRNYCGIEFPDGLVKNQKLEKNVITPTTKGEVDELITAEEIVSQGHMTQAQWDEVSEKAMRIFEHSQRYAAERGLILVDTKYEFGVDKDGNILVIDEVNTCDSSRYWFQATYDECMREGKEPQKYDKDVIRDYIKKTVSDPYSQTEFHVEQEQIDKTIGVYREFFTMLTGCELGELRFTDVVSVIESYYSDEHCKTNDTVVILSGSTSDDAHVQKLIKFANAQGIHTISHVSSAHKNTLEVMGILRKYNDKKGRVVYVTVAGRSNALSGVVASNTQYPTIACPPFKDKDDMMVNINSTLQCPSKVPVMAILEPSNVALACRKIFDLSK